MPKYVVVCRPTPSIQNALSMSSLAKQIDVLTAEKQHSDFCLALRSLRFRPLYLQEDNKFPDGLFTEDPAVILEEPATRRSVLVIARLHNPKRQGEETRLRNFLVPRFFSSFLEIKPPGYLEGGDVLVVSNLRKLYIGLSKRTNEAGAEQLAKIARDFCGYQSFFIKIPETFLHLKGEVSFHEQQGGGHFIVVSEEIAANFGNSGCRLIETPSRERFGGNCISSSRQVLVHAGAPETVKVLEKNGFWVMTTNISQFIIIDGALTCLWKKLPGWFS